MSHVFGWLAPSRPRGLFASLLLAASLAFAGNGPGTRPSDPQAHPPSEPLGNARLALAHSAPPPMTFGKGPRSVTGTSPQARIPDPPRGPAKSTGNGSNGNALVGTAGMATLLTASGPPHVLNDFTADGRSDLLWRNYTSNFGVSKGNLTVFPVSGTTVSAGTVVYNEPSTDWQVVGTGDFEGTGNKGILYWNSNPNSAAPGEVWQILLNGTTVKAQAVIYQEPSTLWRIVAVADFDGDGKADILWRNSSTGAVYLMPMNGQTVLPGQVIYTEPRMEWQIVGAADFNKDGRADILWWNSNTGEVFLQLMDGFTIKASAMVYQASNTHWMIAGLGDFNGDGNADILWRNQWTNGATDGAAGGVYILLMDGLTPGAGATIYSQANPAWQIMTVGDYDGDGLADFLYFNNSTSQVYQICMNGLGIKTEAWLTNGGLVAQGCAAPAIPPLAGPFTAKAADSGGYNLTAVFSGGLGVITPGNLAIQPGGSVLVNPSSQTTYTLTITNGGGMVATTSVVVTPAGQGVSVTLPGAPTTGQPGQQIYFTAQVSGASNTAVTWSCVGGSISTAGVYTAPLTTGTCTVTATSVQDSTQKASVTLTVAGRLTGLKPPCV